ncbi:MAG TPA: cell wall hydrolase [Burkholderiales bacterium]|nr:cell wall hydrolase [Burkholderiales bacterium]
MTWTRLFARSSSRRVSPWSRWWNDLRFLWHTRRKAPWIAAFALCLVVATFVSLMHFLVSRDAVHRELNCLALNVYYEARGEPLAGQYAVAEVTMNRVASWRYPSTVCEVVYQKRWDYLRKRYVSAFSWTEFEVVPHPEGEEWERAREIARAVYHGHHRPTLNGAVLYHATYIKPSWARGKRHVAKIGNHVFYR